MDQERQSEIIKADHSCSAQHGTFNEADVILIHDEDYSNIKFRGINQLRDVHATKLSQLRASLGDNHPQTIKLSISLAEAYGSLGYHHEAVELYSVALEARKNILGDEHQDNIVLYNRLAGAYSSLGMLLKAKELYLWSLKLTRRIYGEYSLNTAALYSNISRCEGHGTKLETLCLNIINQLKCEQVEEDIIISCKTDQLTKLFFKQNVIVWYDPRTKSKSRQERLAELSVISDVEVFHTWQEASDYIKKAQALCQVISSGKDSESFIEAISEEPNVLFIYIFGKDIDPESEWIKKSPKIASPETKFNRLYNKIRTNSIRLDFPAFAAVFNDSDTSHMNKLHFYLRGLTGFRNRDQAKKDFMAIVSQIYTDKKSKEDIEEFTNNYNKYSMNDILTWYTKESFFYKMINNCLRIANSDSILYSRLVTKDLESAIKDYFNSTTPFNGLLYRGAYVTDQEWNSLKANRGREIEMYGFLSTSKDIEVAMDFLKKDRKKKALIIIVVPALPDKSVQGFAEMNEFSTFAEDEVLFNLKSRFTVLKTIPESTTPGMEAPRTLILLYGAETMRNYVSHTNPRTEVRVHKDGKKTCEECQSMISSSNEPVLLFVNLSKQTHYLCNSCMRKPGARKKDPYLCVLLDSNYQKIPQSSLNRKVKGIAMPYSEDVCIPFYGSKCMQCPSTDDNFSPQFSCRTCSDTTNIWCQGCFKTDNKCLRGGHNIVVESNPYTFWSQEMSEAEALRSEYQKENFEDENDFLHGSVFYKVSEYDKAIQFFEKFLERDGSEESTLAASSYLQLGTAYLKTGFTEEAMDCYQKSREMFTKLFNRLHYKVAEVYNEIGYAYQVLGDPEKAVYSYNKALAISGSGMVNNHYKKYNRRYEATSYRYLGLISSSNGRYETAEKFFLNGLRLIMQIFGANHYEVLHFYDGLASVYMDCEDFQQAQDFLERALNSSKMIYGDQHVYTANRYSNIGMFFFNIGNNQKSITNLTKALEINESTNANPEAIAKCYCDLGRLYDVLKEHHQAKELFSKSLEIYRKEFGENDMIAIEPIEHLAGVCNSLKDYPKAIELYTKCIEAKKIITGDQSPFVAKHYRQLASVHKDLKNYQQAIELYLVSLQIKGKIQKGLSELSATPLKGIIDKYDEQDERNQAKKADKINQINLISAHKDLGEIYYNLKEHHKAIDHYSHSLRALHALNGDKNYQSEKDAINLALGNIYFDLKNYSEALQFYNSVLVTAISPSRVTDQGTLDLYIQIARCYANLRSGGKAIESYLEALEVAKDIDEEYSVKVSEIYTELGQIYTETKEHEVAASFHGQSLEIIELLFGESHPHTRKKYKALAKSYRNAGELQKAVEVDSLFIKATKEIFGEQHCKTVKAYSDLVTIYSMLGDHENAARLKAEGGELTKE